ncbi:hypothetical protein ACE38W_11770 [Chitinophaga sp. Hz27]|uniref:hypothetical protein n=1 Tax=Chitinophaga sp. Hz27 TaxID=3347169 RepID=UPI0035DF70E6
MRYFFAALLLLTTQIALAQRFPKDNLYDSVNQWHIKIDDGWFTAKTIIFGDYSTSSRKNGVDESITGGAISSPLKPFSFTLSGKGAKIPVQTMEVTHIAFLNRDLPDFLDRASDKATFFYALLNDSKNDPLKRWELILKTSTYLDLNEDKLCGILRTEGESFRISANNRFGIANSYENICYVFRDGKKTIAAIVPGKNPRIWMRTDVDERTSNVVAAAMAALLLR